MRIRSIRILSQFIFLFLSIIGILGVGVTGLIFPYFFCNASPGAVCVCPIWVLEYSAILFRLDVARAIEGIFYLFGFLGIIGFFVGRSFCGWACPIGFLQDIGNKFKGKFKISIQKLFGLLIVGSIMIASIFFIVGMAGGYLGITGVAIVAFSLYGILLKLDRIIINVILIILESITLFVIWQYFWDTPGFREVLFFIALIILFVSILGIIQKFILPKQRLIRDTKYYDQNRYYLIKYVLLVVIFITSYYYMVKWFTNLDPIGGLTAGVPVLMYEYNKWNVSYLLWIKFIFIGLLFWIIFITYRGFCRFICPVGAIMSPMNKISLQDIKYDDEKCTKCNKCIKSCPMRINIFKMRRNLECIRCGRCVDACKFDAVHMVMVNKTLK